MNCSICEKEIPVEPNGWDQGNNAKPVASGRCCNSCNFLKVVPARMMGKKFQRSESSTEFKMLCNRHLKDGPDGIEVKEYREFGDDDFAAALANCACVVDTALSADQVTGDPPLRQLLASRGVNKFKLVGWQCGFEPMFIAVVDYFGGELSNEKAEEVAVDYLTEISWFSDGATPADYIVDGEVVLSK